MKNTHNVGAQTMVYPGEYQTKADKNVKQTTKDDYKLHDGTCSSKNSCDTVQYLEPEY